MLNTINDLSVMEILKMFAPLIALQFGLAIFCIVQIVKHGVKNLSKAAWIVIVIIFELLGPVAFLLFGRKRDY